MEGGETRMRRVSLETTRRALEPALRRVLHAYWRFARAMTLGVRALVIDGEGRVFLVKHSYVSGWHLPGGGSRPARRSPRRWRASCRRRAISK